MSVVLHQCRMCLAWFEGDGEWLDGERFCSVDCRVDYVMEIHDEDLLF